MSGPVRRRLVLTIGERERYLALEGGKECLVGRQLDAGFFLNHTSVSRRHCILRATPTGVEIEDVGGRNASYVNGQRILTRTLLTEGAVVQFGSLAFTIHFLDDDGPIRCGRCATLVPAQELAGSPEGEPLCAACSKTYASGNDKALVKLIHAQGYSVTQSLGGIPATFEVERTALKRGYVIKAIELNRIERERVDALRQEARTLAALEHPGITTLSDAIETKGVLLIVLPRTAGTSLEKHVADRGPLSAKEAVRLARSLAEALVYLHRKGIVHREVTPPNVLVSGEGAGLQARLANFPLTRDIAELSRSFSGGGALDRLVYVAPEIIADPAANAPLADVFGLGAVIAGAVTGRSPYGSVPATEHVMRVLNRAPFSLALDGVPSVLEGPLRRLLATNPAERPPSAEAALALLASLETALENEDREFRGVFEHDELIEYVQLLALNSKTGQLEVRGPERVGRIWLVSGVVEWAESEPRADTAAVPRLLLKLRSGQFRFRPDVKPPADVPRLQLATPALLLDAMRERDEERTP